MTIEIAAGTAAWMWLRRLGGPGLILLGLADNSFIPMPGGMDLLTIVLAAHHKGWWWYYAIMATVGAVAGGYITYRIGRKGGKAYVESRFPKKRVEKVYKRFEHGGGFWAVAIPAILPPPIPYVPFLLAAGAFNYPRRKFLAAITLGRAVRYFTVAYLSQVYGKQIVTFVDRYYKPILWIFIAMSAFGFLSGLFLYYKQKKTKHSSPKPSEQVA